MLLAVGIFAMLVVIVVAAVLTARMLRKQQDEAPPPSQGADFVAPVSSGGYRFRAPDESPEEFKARVEAENEEIAASQRGAELSQKQ